jgi:hypothetical protein
MSKVVEFLTSIRSGLLKDGKDWGSRGIVIGTWKEAQGFLVVACTESENEKSVFGSIAGNEKRGMNGGNVVEKAVASEHRYQKVVYERDAFSRPSHIECHYLDTIRDL